MGSCQTEPLVGSERAGLDTGPGRDKGLGGGDDNGWLGVGRGQARTTGAREDAGEGRGCAGAALTSPFGDLQQAGSGDGDATLFFRGGAGGLLSCPRDGGPCCSLWGQCLFAQLCRTSTCCVGAGLGQQRQLPPVALMPPLWVPGATWWRGQQLPSPVHPAGQAMLPGAAAVGPISPIPRSQQPPAPHSPFVSVRQKHSLFRGWSPDKGRFVSWEELVGLGRGSTIRAWEAPLQRQLGLSWHPARPRDPVCGGGGAALRPLVPLASQLDPATHHWPLPPVSCWARWYGDRLTGDGALPPSPRWLALWWAGDRNPTAQRSQQRKVKLQWHLTRKQHNAQATVPTPCPSPAR